MTVADVLPLTDDGDLRVPMAYMECAAWSGCGVVRGTLASWSAQNPWACLTLPVDSAVATAVFGVVAVRTPAPADEMSPVLVVVEVAVAELEPVVELAVALAVALPCRLVDPETWALIWVPARQIDQATHA